MHLLSNLKIIRLIYYLTTIFYLVQEFYFESMIYTLKLVFFLHFFGMLPTKSRWLYARNNKNNSPFCEKGRNSNHTCKKCFAIFQNWQLGTAHACSSCLMVSTDQADSRSFYFRISWILMEWRWFYFFRPLHLVQGLRSNNIK